MIGIDLQGPGEISLAGLPDVVYPFTYLGTVAYYPNPSRGLYVKGGVGCGLPWTSSTNSARQPLPQPARVSAAWRESAGTFTWASASGSHPPQLPYVRPGDMVLEGQVRVDNWSDRSVDVTLGVKFD